MKQPTTYNKQPATHLAAFLILLLLVVSCWSLVGVSPALAQEATDPGYLIVCDGADCEFKHLALLVVRLINFMIVISTILATAAFAWAGILLMTSGGKEASKTKAKDIFWKVVWGYVWILGAWLLVYTISSVLLKEGYFFLGGPR